MVALRNLGPLGDLLGEGALGAVYRTTYELPNYQGALAYKEILKSVPVNKQQQGLRDMRRAVLLRQSLSARDRAYLDQYSAWPLEMVTEAGRDVGCLLPLIPSSFFMHLSPVGGASKDVPRGLEWISAPETLCRKAGIPQAEFEEFSEMVSVLAVFAKLIFVIGLLHRHGMVYGDISLKNAVFAMNPPRVMLLDCDSVAPQADLNRHQMNSPFLFAPESLAPGSNRHARGNSGLQDARTDVFKLGCLVARGLSRGSGATQLRSAKHLKSELNAATFQILEKALNENPNTRPSAKDLFTAIVEFVQVKSTPPLIKSFYGVSTVVPRGSDVTFLWEAENASTARIYGPNGYAQDVDPAWGQYSLPSIHSGKYLLEVRRKGYVVTQESDFIQVFEVPQFDVTSNHLLVPNIPSIQAVELGATLESLPIRPGIDIGTSFVPDLGVPNGDLFQELSRGLDFSRVNLATGATENFELPAIDRFNHGQEVANRLTETASVALQALDEAQKQILVSLQVAAEQSMQRHLEAIEVGVAAKASSLAP